jgi:DNA polymerase-3 subunit beta
MKFKASSHDLFHHLGKAAGAISTNPVLPVLEDFLFTLRGNLLTITATNLETTVITEMQISSDEDGQIAVPAKILMDTLRALPDQPVTLTVDEKTRGIEITSAYGKYRGLRAITRMTSRISKWWMTTTVSCWMRLNFPAH